MSGYDPQRTRRRPIATRANAQAVESLLGESTLPPKPVRADHAAGDTTTTGLPPKPVRADHDASTTTTTGLPPKPVAPTTDHDASTTRTGPDVSSLSARGGCLGVLLGLGRR